MTRADKYDVKVVLDDGLDPVANTEIESNPFAVPPAEGVQVASLQKNIKSIIQAYNKGGKKPLSDVWEDVNTNSKPASSIDDAEEIITTPTGAKTGRPSADDITQSNLNFNNINSTDDVKTLLNTVSEQQDHSYNTTRRGTVTHEQTQIEAESYDALALLLGRKPGDAFNAAQITAARNLLVDSAEKLQAQAARIAENGADDLTMLKFRQDVAKHSGIQAQVAGMTSEAARALNAFKISAQGGKVRTKQIQDILESTGGSDAGKALAKRIAEAGNVADVSDLTRTHAYATKSDMILEYWINGLLSGLTTHAANMTGNSVTTIWAIPERFLAAGVRKARKTPDGVRAGEVVAQVYGMIHGFNDGLRLGWQALKTGEPTDPLMKVEQGKFRAITAGNVSRMAIGKTSAFGLSPAQVEAGGTMAKAVDLLGEFIRLPGRFLGAEDELFKAVNYRMELHAQAYRTAVHEDLEGEALARRIQDLIENPTDEIHLNADAMAQYQTFTNPLGEDLKGIQASSNRHPVVKLVIPFMRTPTNIIKYVGERTPLAWMSTSVKADILGGGAKSDLALAKISLGSMLLISGGLLGWEEKISGSISGPAKSAKRRKGLQANSIKLGDTWYAINRLDPLSAFFTMSADVAQIIKYSDSETDILKATAIAAHAVAKSLTSKTYLRGVSDILEAINSQSEYKIHYVLKRYAASFMPATSMVAGVERVVDPMLRSSFTVLDEICARTPGCSDSLPPRRNLWGEPIVLQGAIGPDIVSPIYTSTEKTSLADEEIINNDVSISMPRKWIGSGRFKIELSAEEYDAYVFNMGKEVELPAYWDGNKKLTLKRFLESYMRTSAYKAATTGPDGLRAKFITDAVAAFKSAAQQLLLEDNIDLYKRYVMSEARKSQAMTGEEVPEELIQQQLGGR